MNHITADQALLDRLAGLMEPVQIRDATGKVLGCYSPIFSDEQEKNERAAKYFDLAQAERQLAERKNSGSSLEEVWKRIHSGERMG